MSLPHPAWRNDGWLKREPWFEAELLPVLKAEVARVLQDGPGSSDHGDASGKKRHGGSGATGRKHVPGRWIMAKHSLE